jgi:hypothetical protein
MGLFSAAQTEPALNEKPYHSSDDPFRAKSLASYQKGRRMNSIRRVRLCTLPDMTCTRSKQVAKSAEVPQPLGGRSRTPGRPTPYLVVLGFANRESSSLGFTTTLSLGYLTGLLDPLNSSLQDTVVSR